MDETQDRPASDKKEGSARWTRHGYYVNIEKDLELKRFPKPNMTEQSEKYDEILETLEGDVEEAEESFSKIHKQEKLVKKSIKRRIQLNEGAPPKNNSEKELMAMDMTDLEIKRENLVKRRLKAHSALKKAQDALKAHHTREISDTRVKNKTIFMEGGNWNMVWSAVPDYAGKEGIFPDREPTAPLYAKLKHMLTVDFLKVDHDEIVSLLTRIRSSLSASKYHELLVQF